MGTEIQYQLKGFNYVKHFLYYVLQLFRFTMMIPLFFVLLIVLPLYLPFTFPINLEMYYLVIIMTTIPVWIFLIIHLQEKVYNVKTNHGFIGLFYRNSFTDVFEYRYRINDEGLIIRGKKIDKIYPWIKIRKAWKNNSYYHFKTKTNKIFCIPIKYIGDKEMSALDRALDLVNDNF